MYQIVSSDEFDMNLFVDPFDSSFWICNGCYADCGIYQKVTCVVLSA